MLMATKIYLSQVESVELSRFLYYDWNDFDYGANDFIFCPLPRKDSSNVTSSNTHMTVVFNVQ